jgi:hypothetical protein
MRPGAFAVALGLSLALSGPCRADDLVALELFSGTAVSFELKGQLHNVTLSIAGPGGFHASASSRSGAPKIDLAQSGPVRDGPYKYQLSAATNEKVPTRTTLDDGRPAKASEQFKSVGKSGTFRVRDGAIVKADPNAREDTRRQK